MNKLCNADYGSCDFSCDNKIGRCKLICTVVEVRVERERNPEAIVIPITGRDYRMNKCENPICTYEGKLTFHHFWPKYYRVNGLGRKTKPIAERQRGIMLCQSCHTAVHKFRTNKELVEQGYTTKEKIIELLNNIHHGTHTKKDSP